ncbi:TadE family type IV pilus minor pilin [Actinoplanes derwentensis]|uniref:TadE family type IV pilus minor pilin n=1 Tax=Actinoplanes derwentensis TaxID=113562 RepID=UPI000B87AE5A|nr:TadE family type IV pilus minor pilin [Actinoplanes derwentensis]
MGGDRDRGAFTAELAAGLPALMLLLSFGMTAVSAIAIKMQCQDAAREAALAESRGEPPMDVAERIAPNGASIQVGGDGDSVTAEVLAPVRMLGWDLPGVVVRGYSVAAREPEQIGF